MNPEQSTKALKSIGISAGIIAGISILVVGAVMYRNYIETKKFKLEIEKLKRDLKV